MPSLTPDLLLLHHRCRRAVAGGDPAASGGGEGEPRPRRAAGPGVAGDVAALADRPAAAARGVRWPGWVRLCPRRCPPSTAWRLFAWVGALGAHRSLADSSSFPASRATPWEAAAGWLVLTRLPPPRLCTRRAREEGVRNPISQFSERVESHHSHKTSCPTPCRSSTPRPRPGSPIPGGKPGQRPQRGGWGRRSSPSGGVRWGGVSSG